MWRQISEHYKDYSENLLFEILNEPHNELKEDVWNEMLVEVLAVMRETNPTRNVVIGPVSWNNVSAFPTLKLPADDKHIIATFHYYSPFHFTHQGASWAGDSADDWLGTTWNGTEVEKNAVIKDFNIAVKFGEDNNCPIYVGEFGAYEKADINSRAIWTAFIARTAEEKGFSWSYWEFCAGFGFWDKNANEWREPLLNALVPEE